ncbi:MAG: fibronectin type III domain-containing protein, partial [Chloroflexota bacterium]
MRSATTCSTSGAGGAITIVPCGTPGSELQANGWVFQNFWGQRQMWLSAQGIKDAPIPYGTHNFTHNIQVFNQPDNKWICYEAHIKNNTPGQADGLYEQYATNMTDKGPTILTSKQINRRFLGDTPNDLMPADSKWERIRMYRQAGLGQRYYDNITVSTTRQGCSGTPPPPPPPDTQAPSVPAVLGAQTASSSQINLTWTAATDNVGVTGYRIFRGGTQIATTAGTSYSNTGLTASTAYSYTVAAYDAAGNTSGQSSSVSATTQASTSAPVGTVSNLSAVAAGANAATLSFTEVSDGTGQPATYNIRFSSSGALWGAAPSVTQGTCASPLTGTTVGATKTCTV